MQIGEVQKADGPPEGGLQFDAALGQVKPPRLPVARVDQWSGGEKGKQKLPAGHTRGNVLIVQLYFCQPIWPLLKELLPAQERDR